MTAKRNEYKVLKVLIYFAISIVFLSSCGKERQSEIQQDSTIITVEETTEQVEEITEIEEALLPGIYPMEFTFSSGAGAWSTIITLSQDGSFDGVYRDFDMGDGIEDYPNGSVYISVFSGNFGDIKRINDYTYSITLSEMSIQYKEGEEWIEDKFRYVASAPYGIESGKEFILYTPETPVKELPEDFLSWWPNLYFTGEEALEILSCYGIYNKELGYGFFTYE